MNVSKNQVVWARCHLAGLASGQLCTIMSSGVSGLHSARLWLRVAMKAVRSPGALSVTAADIDPVCPYGFGCPALLERENGLAVARTA
jgi:hypothetical protein